MSLGGAIASIVFLVVEIAVVAVVAYFVIKKAVKDALRERDKEKQG